MRNAITAFSVPEKVNLDLKSAVELKAYGLELKATNSNFRQDIT